MAVLTFPKKELKTIIKESMREIFRQELMNFWFLLLPFVSQKEQKDIEKRYGKPSREIAKTIDIKV